MPATSRIISTLCPKRLQPSDCVDISSRSWATVKLQCGASHVRYNKSNWNATGPFPPNTRGFFYYHTPPKAPPLIGEIRFRCANTLDDFHNGEDLLSKDKFQTPWSIPLYTLANYAYYAKWGEQLVLDNLVTQATLDKWVISAKRNVRRDRPVLYYLTQPFFFRFNSHTIAFYAVTKDGISSYTPNNPMKDKRLRYNIPYRGSGLVRLEPYLNPQFPKQGRVALRVLKIIEPVKPLLEDYDGYVHQPAEGELIQRSNVDIPVSSFGLKGAAILPVNFDDLP